MSDYLHWPLQWRVLYWAQCVAVGCALVQLITRSGNG